MIRFGSGKILALPVTLGDGTALSNITPVEIATLQDVSVDIEYDTKQLYGGNQYPIDIARGKGKISVKAKSANFGASATAQLMLGQQVQAKRNGVVMDFAASVPATPGPYTITIAPPNSGVFATNLGVVNVVTGQSMTRVASSPTTGQYSLNTNTGVYTFAAADQGTAVLISYEYTIASSTTSQLVDIASMPMGYTPSFAALLYNQYQGRTQVLKLNACVLGKDGQGLKQDDYASTDLDISAYADAQGKIGYLCQYQ